jgi:hypothetical protein
MNAFSLSVTVISIAVLSAGAQTLDPGVYRGVIYREHQPSSGVDLVVSTNGSCSGSLWAIGPYTGGMVIRAGTEIATNKPNGFVRIRFPRMACFRGTVRHNGTNVTGRLIRYYDGRSVERQLTLRRVEPGSHPALPE